MKNPKRLEISLSVLLACLFLVISCTNNPANDDVVILQQITPHPLNPLDTNEIKLARQVLLDEGKIDTAYRFYLINLNEPPKAEMLKYKTGDPFRREAIASVYDRSTNTTYESVIDLIGKKSLSFYNVPGVTPGAFLKDSVTDELLEKNPEWLAGLKGERDPSGFR